MFRYHDRVVSLLVTGGAGFGKTDPAIVPVGSTLNIASFDVGAHAVFVVSDLPAPDTLIMAQALSAPVRTALERG